MAFSRRAANGLRRRGFRAWCLPDAMAALGPWTTPSARRARIVERYDTPTLRDV